MTKKKTTRKKTTARRKPSARTAASAKEHHHPRGRRRGLWKGSLAFGLVNIPIYLESAEQEKKIHFHLIDKRDHAPVGYKQINKSTGHEITRASVVKGYEYEKGQYVLMGEADFKKANVKATSTIEIEDFVELQEINPMLFEKPYYVLPQKGGEKGYALLREVLERTQKAAVAKIVLHTVQHLVCLMVRGDYLILEILRFANEIIEQDEADFMEPQMRDVRISPKELAVAEQLVEGMTEKWKPEKYHNTYRDDLMKLIKAKIKRGATAEVEKIEPVEEAEDTSNVIDLTALLKRSLSGTHRKSPGETPPRKSAGGTRKKRSS